MPSLLCHLKDNHPTTIQQNLLETIYNLYIKFDIKAINHQDSNFVDYNKINLYHFTCNYKKVNKEYSRMNAFLSFSKSYPQIKISSIFDKNRCQFFKLNLKKYTKKLPFLMKNEVNDVSLYNEILDQPMYQSNCISGILSESTKLWKIFEKENKL
jgi:hypothetical protein